MDINPTLARVIQNSMTDTTLSVKKPGSMGPWRLRPPTLVGSMTLLLRVSGGGLPCAKVRLVEPFERMRMIGWPDSAWQQVPESMQTMQFNDLVCNMTGNAYSVFHFGPWQLATLAVMGRYHCELGGRFQDVAEDVESSLAGDSSSGSMGSDDSD
jgi:hypothetical protein